MRTDVHIMTPVALLPCPFCGGPPVPSVFRPSHHGGGPLTEDLIDKTNGTRAEAYVRCHECGARSGKVDLIDAHAAGASSIVFDMTDVAALELVAVKQWNDRGLRNLQLYVAGYQAGHHLYPRPPAKESST